MHCFLLLVRYFWLKIIYLVNVFVTVQNVCFFPLWSLFAHLCILGLRWTLPPLYLPALSCWTSHCSLQEFPGATEQSWELGEVVNPRSTNCLSLLKFLPNADPMPHSFWGRSPSPTFSLTNSLTSLWASLRPQPPFSCQPHVVWNAL